MDSGPKHKLRPAPISLDRLLRSRNQALDGRLGLRQVRLRIRKRRGEASVGLHDLLNDAAERRENLLWGYRRIVGELRKRGHAAGLSGQIRSEEIIRCGQSKRPNTVRMNSSFFRSPMEPLAA